MTSTDGATAPRRRPWRSLVLLLPVVLLGVFRVFPVHDSDLPWHLHEARQLLQFRRLLHPETGGFSMPGRPFVSMEWLSELGLYALQSLGGWTALSLLSGVAVVLAGALLLRVSRDEGGDGGFRDALAVTLGLCAAMLRFQPRPHLVDLVGAPLVMLLARGCFAATGAAFARRAVGLVALEVVWAQAHGSFVIVPPLCFAAGVAAATDRRSLLRALGVTGVLGLATLANPLGVGMFRNMLAHAGTDAARQIGEMAPPRLEQLLPFSLAMPLTTFLWALAALAVVDIVRTRTIRRDDAIRALLGLALASSSVRFLGLLGLLLVPWAARGLGHFGGLSARAAGLVALLLPVAAYRAVVATVPDERMGIGLNRTFLPVDAAEAMRRAGASGRVWNHYRDGGWIEWTNAPRVQVFIDGRVPPYFSEAVLAEHIASVGDPGAFARIDGRFGLRYALVARVAGLCRTLSRDPRWGAVYVDARRVLFAREGAPWRGERLQITGRCGTGMAIPVGDERVCPGCCARLTADARVMRRLTPDAVLPRAFAALAAARCERASGTRVRALVSEVLGARHVATGELLMAGDAALAVGDVALAERCADRAIALADAPDARVARARVMVAQSRYEAAVEDFAAAVEGAGPSVPWGMRLEYARALAAAGRTDEARIEAERAGREGGGAAAMEVLRAIGP